MNDLQRAVLIPCLVIAAACSDSQGPGDRPVVMRVVAEPADTALYVNAAYSLRVAGVDSTGAPLPFFEASYESLDPGVLSVDADGLVSAVAYGRGRVVARNGTPADTVFVSVVPQGRIAMGLRSDLSAVELFNLDGSGHESLVPSGQAGGAAPAWNPQGDLIAFQYMTPGGAGLSTLRTTDLDGQSAPLLPAGQGFFDEKYPRFSPDGAWIYFRAAGLLTAGEIWRIQPDGQGLEQVGESATYTGDTQPDPSPDGTRLVFSTNRLSAPLELAIRDLASGDEALIGGAPGLLPRWSPAGDWIAYWDWDQVSPRGTLHVVRPDGTGNRLVSPAGRLYRPDGLDWSPDGQWLIARTDDRVELVNVETGLVLPLPYSADYTWASWER